MLAHSRLLFLLFLALSLIVSTNLYKKVATVVIFFSTPYQ